jgi:hypothetical protein
MVEKGELKGSLEQVMQFSHKLSDIPDERVLEERSEAGVVTSEKSSEHGSDSVSTQGSLPNSC